MERVKIKQKFKEGAYVKIQLSDERVIFGRLMVKYRILVYDFITTLSNGILSISEIKSRKPLFYCGIFKDVVTSGSFEIIGFEKLEQNDLDALPPMFWQNYFDYRDCSIYYYNGDTRKVSPQDCIGVERGAAWEAAALVQRIEDHFAGRKNFEVELAKPILSQNDIRYLPQPQILKWDFVKQEFYRQDR